MCMCVHMYLGYMAEEDAMFLGGKGKSCRGSLSVLARPKVTGWFLSAWTWHENRSADEKCQIVTGIGKRVWREELRVRRGERCCCKLAPKSCSFSCDTWPTSLWLANWIFKRNFPSWFPFVQKIIKQKKAQKKKTKRGGECNSRAPCALVQI